MESCARSTPPAESETRRNQTETPNDDAPNYMPYAYMTDMQEENIVFGGEKKLADAVREGGLEF